MVRFAFLFCAVFTLFVSRAETVLVLPFSNQSNSLNSSTNVDWIGESISEAIRESLASEGLLALEREDRLEAFRRLSLRTNALLTRASVIKVGEALDASKVIYGYYGVVMSSTGSTGAGQGALHIGARILDLKHVRQGADLEESGELDDLATLEARLAWDTLKALSPRSAPTEEAFLRDRPRVRLDALESYIRGLLAANPEQQRRFFMQAARLDAAYSQPCFQLGKSYWGRRDYKTAATWLDRVHRGDPHYLEAQFFLGLCDYHTGDYTAATKCFETVAATVPLNEVYNDLGAAQMRTNPASAVESFRKALEGDDTDLDYQFNLGYALWKAGQFAEAAKAFRAVLERNPDDQQAAALLARAEHRETPRADSEGRERLKTNYEETAYRQLKAELGK